MIPLLLAADNPRTLTLGGGSSAVKLFLLLTVLSFATALLVSITSFTRIVIVISFVRVRRWARHHCLRIRSSWRWPWR